MRCQGCVTSTKPRPCSARCLWLCPMCLPPTAHRLTVGASHALWPLFSSSPRYLWASLVAQMVNNTCIVGDLGSIPGFGRSLEEDMATHSSILAWSIHMDREAWWAAVHWVTKSPTTTERVSMMETFIVFIYIHFCHFQSAPYFMCSLLMVYLDVEFLT